MPVWTHLWILTRRLTGFILRRGESNVRTSIEDVLETAHPTDTGFTNQEEKMLRNLLGFRDVRVEEVMVPRADIVAVEEKTSRAGLLKKFVAGAHSRMPVYRKTLDDPLGFIHIKDILKSLRTNRMLKLDKLVRPVIGIPPSMPALELLQTMQQKRTHMALVIDEYGGTDGLVTIEDLIEEIIGEIDDEHNNDDGARVRNLDTHAWRADARIELVVLAEALKTIFPLEPDADEEYDTLGGFICTLAGRVPQRGEIIEFALDETHLIEFVIRDADPRRLKTVDIYFVDSTKQKMPQVVHNADASLPEKSE